MANLVLSVRIPSVDGQEPSQEELTEIKKLVSNVLPKGFVEISDFEKVNTHKLTVTRDGESLVYLINNDSELIID